MKTEVLVQANTTQSSNFASTDQFRFREAFVEVGNVLASNPSADFWAGERYYRRLNIDINYFFYLDMSGYGGGLYMVPSATANDTANVVFQKNAANVDSNVDGTVGEI